MQSVIRFFQKHMHTGALNSYVHIQSFHLLSKRMPGRCKLLSWVCKEVFNAYMVSTQKGDLNAGQGSVLQRQHQDCTSPNQTEHA